MEAERTMTEQDTTPQDNTNTSQDNQNTTDNNTPDQTTTQHNAPHYITKSTQHNTKNLPLQVLGDGTSEHLEISSHEVVRGRLLVIGEDGQVMAMGSAPAAPVADWWKDEKGEI